VTLEELETKVWESAVEVLPQTYIDLSRPHNIDDVKKALFGDPDNVDPINLRVEKGGKIWLLSFQVEDLDSFSWKDLGNVVIIDKKPEIREYVIHTKMALEGRRGYVRPQIHTLTQAMLDGLQMTVPVAHLRRENPARAAQGGYKGASLTPGHFDTPEAQDARARVAHLDDAETLERLAELEHEQWAHWTRHILDVMEPALDLMQDRYDNGYSDDAEDRCLESVDRWNRQIATPYGELSDGEMESDRVWARRVLATLEAP